MAKSLIGCAMIGAGTLLLVLCPVIRNTMMKSMFFIQAIGFVGTAVFILSYQIKSNRRLFLLQLIGTALFCVQFFLLDAKSGCFSLAANMVRNAMLMKYSDWKWVRWKGWPFVFGGVFAVILYGTWNGPISLLAFAASLACTFGYWSNNARMIRLANLVCACPCWLTYDIIVGSWGGVLNESVTLLSILISIIRFGWAGLGNDPDFNK